MRKGVSLASLMITIVIIMLLATTVAISASSSINDSRKISFATEISFIQEAVNHYYMKHGNIPVLEKIEMNLSTLDEENRLEFKGENVNNDIVQLYRLDLPSLGKIDTVFGNDEKERDYYAVSLDTNRVYYVLGLHVGEKNYYSLTDELRSIIRYFDNSLTDNIIFSKSISKWTNQNIDVQILIPSEYSNINIVVKQSGNVISNVSNSILNGKYHQYMIEGISGNYNISVSYLKNNENKNISFVVDNYDNEKPTYQVSDRKNLDNGDERYSYIELYDVNDNLSGISKMKYMKSEVSEGDIRENGIDIQDGILELDDDTEYITIYIEDNAENYDYRVLDVRGK
ncbi:MAG: type II secretion system protein [Clostridia bacterium]|nr:type II secretion system protein [Clostridia bacterium]